MYCLFAEKQFNIVDKPPSCPENFQLINEEIDNECNVVPKSQGMLSI